MKGYLLDTNIVSALWDAMHKHHATAQSFLAALAPESPVFTSPIVKGEIEYGLEVHDSVQDERWEQFRALLNEFNRDRMLQITEHTADVYGKLRAKVFRQFAERNSRERVKTKRPEDLIDKTSGKELGIQENDLWLAAQAVERNLVLITNDSMTRIVTAVPELQTRMLSSNSEE